MIGLVVFLLVAGWVFKSTFGKAFVLTMGVLGLAFLVAMGASGGLLFGLCLVSVAVAALGLARRFR